MVQSTNIASSYLYQFLLFLAHAGKTQLSFLSAAKYKLANQKPYKPLRNPPPPPIKRQGKPPLTQHNIIPLLYKTQLSKQITFTEAWYAPDIHKSFWLPHFYTLKMSIPIKKTPALKKFSPWPLTRSDNTANFAFNPISCFTQLLIRYTRKIQKTPNFTTLRRWYLKYCKLKDKNTRR